MGLEEKQGLVELGRDLGRRQRLGSPLLWRAMVWSGWGEVPAQDRPGSCGGPGLELISPWKGSVQAVTFRGAGLLLARHQASTHAIRPILKRARERLHVRDRGGFRTGGKGLARAWESGDLASSPGSAPGSGDLGLLPAHLLASLPPTYER